MSTVLVQRLATAERRRVGNEFDRQSFRVRAIKILSGLLLGVCFWFSVPYYLPLKMDPNPKKAAANEAAAYEGNFSRQVAMPIIGLVAAYLLWRLPKRGRFGSRLMPIACCYVGWALLSASWSEDPSITIKRLVVFSINCFFAFMLARVFTVTEIALWGYAQTGIIALISLWVDLFKEHNFAPFDPEYRFNGVMTANYQAMNLVIGMICALTLLQKRPQWFRWIAPGVGLSLVLLYLTRSRLGAILGICMLAIMVVRLSRQRLQPHARAMLLVAGLTLAVPTLIYVIGKSGEQAAQSAFMMGRNDTENTSNLSNRAPLWAELMESVRNKPLTGYGYEAFWTPARVEKISADQGWMVPHAHDTYLDQTLSLGVIGMLLYVGMLWGGAAIGWIRYRRIPSETSLYPAILLTWLALTGIAESVPLDPYLPTMLAYSCIIKMCMVEGSEVEDDRGYSANEIIRGLPGASNPALATPTSPALRPPVKRYVWPGLVSIIIPTYKRLAELRLAVDSALGQTYANVEVIVVSDGPDAEVRAAMQDVDARLRYIELTENGGPAEARNAGVRASRGEWLTFLDDDDSMLPEKVEHQLRLGDANQPKKMISCRTIYRHDGQDDIWPTRTLAPSEDIGDYILLRPSLLGRPGVLPVQSLLMHHSLIKQTPFSTHKDHEDWAWLLEVWHVAGARIEFAWEPLVVYNIVTDSISRSRRMNWRDSLQWANQYRKWLSRPAYNSFLSTKVALKTKRAGDWKGLREVAGLVLRNRPQMLDLLFLSGMMLLPGFVLHMAWKRSLSAGKAGKTKQSKPEKIAEAA